MKLIHIIVAAAIIVVALIVLSHVRGQTPEVGVARAKVGDMLLEVVASGLVEADGADLGFQSGGRIVELYVQEGDRVSRSQLLARLVSVPAAPITGSADVIQAPHDGSVVTVYRREGAVVQPGEPVLRVVSDGAPRVIAFVESDDAMHLRAGQKLRCRAGGYLSQPWDLTIEQVGTEAVSRPDIPGSSRQVRVRCAPTSAGFPIPAGTEVDVDGHIPLVEQGLLIPTAAIIHTGIEDTVWLVSDDRVQRRPVVVGPNNFDLIQIREGLQAGDVVVVEGKDEVSDGRRVRTRPVPPMDRASPGG